MTAPHRRRLSVPSGWGLLLVLGVPVIVLTVLAVGYYRYIHYTRVAVRHVPAGAYFAARVDLEQVVLFEPFRKHLLPVLNRARGGEGGSEGTPTRIARIEKALSTNLALDTREVVWAIGPEASQWTLIIGGLYPRGRVVAGLTQALSSDAQLSVRPAGDGTSLEISPWQVFVGQADDGAVVVSSSEAQLRAALTSSEAFLGLGLHQEGPGSFGLTRTVVPEEWRAAFGAVESLSGSLGLGDVVTATVDLSMASASQAEEQRAQATAVLTTAQAIAALQPNAGAFALREVLARAQVSTAGVSSASGNHVQFRTFWQLGEVDHIAEELGTALERRLH